MFYYLSYSTSGIQKIILRYGRLWSITGISNLLAWLTECESVKIVKKYSGTLLLAGGGKLTACFDCPNSAETAREEIIKLFATNLPPMELQISEVVQANSFAEADKDEDGKRILKSLSSQKSSYRGSFSTFLPHLKLCEECGQLPATTEEYFTEGKKMICSICVNAREHHERLLKLSQGDSTGKEKINTETNIESETSIEKVYKNYLCKFKCRDNPLWLSCKSLSFPSNIEEITQIENQNNDEKSSAIALWASDLNNMGKKIPLWIPLLEGEPEKSVQERLQKVYDIIIEITTVALVETFAKKEVYVPKEKQRKTHPFRLIVCGGDDLAIVMDARYAFDFALNFHNCMKTFEETLEETHPLSQKYLMDRAKKLAKELNENDYSFSWGAGLIFAPMHTPFHHIYNIAEMLVGEAKSGGREMNRLYWCSLESPAGDINLKQLITAPTKRPYAIDELKDYINLARCLKNLISSTNRNIVMEQIRKKYRGNNLIAIESLEDWLLSRAGRQPAPNDKNLLLTALLYESKTIKTGKLDPARVMDMLKLMELT